MKFIDRFEFEIEDCKEVELPENIIKIVDDDTFDKLYFLTGKDNSMLVMGIDFRIAGSKIEFISARTIPHTYMLEIYDTTDYLEKIYYLQNQFNISRGIESIEISKIEDHEFINRVFLRHLFYLNKVSSMVLEEAMFSQNINKEQISKNLTIILSELITIYQINGMTYEDIVKNYMNMVNGDNDK